MGLLKSSKIIIKIFLKKFWIGNYNYVFLAKTDLFPQLKLLMTTFTMFYLSNYHLIHSVPLDGDTLSANTFTSHLVMLNTTCKCL